MAYYAYKQVRDLLPQHIIDAQGPDYEGDANYDGDQWCATADYIEELKQRIAELEQKNAQLLKALKSALWRMKEYNYQAMEGTIAKARAAIKAAEVKP